MISRLHVVAALLSFVIGPALIALLSVTGHPFLSLLLGAVLCGYWLAEITVWELRNLATRRRTGVGCPGCAAPTP